MLEIMVIGTYLFNMVNNCYLSSPRFKKCITLKFTKRSNQYLQARAKSNKKLENKIHWTN